MKLIRATKDEKKNDSFGSTLKGTQLDGYYNRKSQSNSTTLNTLIGLTRLGAASSQSKSFSSVTQANSFDQLELNKLETLRKAFDFYEENFDRYTQSERSKTDLFWNRNIGNPFRGTNYAEIDHHEGKEKAPSPKNNKF